MKNELVVQEDSMGCAVACLASILGISYKNTLKTFGIKNAVKPNFYCKDIAKILRNKKFNYLYGKITSKTKHYLYVPGTIIFIRRSKKYPVGHYLLKTERGWMNPWVNLPEIPIKAGFQKKLPGKAQWIIYEAQ